MFRRALLATLVLSVGCRTLPDPLDRPTGDAASEASIRLELEPPADFAAAPRVLRLRVMAPDGIVLSGEELMLFAGELSAYHLRRIERGDLPNTLIERLVPSVSWSEPDAVVLAPTLPLAPGEQYSLAAATAGLIGTIRVLDSDDATFLQRRWPPLDGGRGVRHAVFCGDGGGLRRSMQVVVDPGEHLATLAPGAGRGPELDPDCVQLSVDEDLPSGALALPPPEVAGLALDPAPLTVSPGEANAPASCQPSERRLASGCVSVMDDRLVVRGGESPEMWMIGLAEQPLRNVEPETRFVVTGLTPNTQQTIEVVVLDLEGRATRDVQSFWMGSALPHVVINEVLANAVGPEPAQEWVELVNDGTEPVDLTGWVLQDVGGETELPGEVLAPGQYAVVIGADYEPDPFLDVPPAEGTLLLQVDRVGKSGLANSGEPLRLRDAAGSVRSAFPGLPASEAGVSVARRHPWSLDDDPDAFLLHGGEGASPGAPNQTP